MGQIGGGTGGGSIGGPQGLGGGEATGGARPVSAALLMREREDQDTAHDASELRAQLDAALARVRELELDNQTQHQQLAEMAAQIARDARRAELDLALAEAGAVDVPTARVLAEMDLAADPALEVVGAVELLRRTKAYLFGRASITPARRTSAMAAGTDEVLARSARLTELADEAKASGDRGALLRYLRARG
jgi:hypothetical protein